MVLFYIKEAMLSVVVVLGQAKVPSDNLRRVIEQKLIVGILRIFNPLFRAKPLYVYPPGN